MDLRSNQGLKSSIGRSARDFAELEQEWAELYDNSPKATPFQSWAWLYSWWENYGGDYKLRLLTVREGSTLVGILPLMLDERRLGLGRLLFIGTGITDYLDIVVREGWEERVCRAAVEALRGMGGWRVADLQELRPGAAAWGIIEHWSGPAARIEQSRCPVIATAGSREELLSRLSSNFRSNVRGALRKARADGVRREPVSVDVEAAARRLVALHRESWEGQGITPEHLSRRFEGHLVAAARRMTKDGLGEVHEYWREGEMILSTFLLFGKDFVGGYLSGGHEDIRRRYQVSSVRTWHELGIAHDRGLSHLDLLRGEESYKLRWKPDIVTTYRAFLGRGSFSWGLYAGYWSLRSRAKKHLRVKK